MTNLVFIPKPGERPLQNSETRLIALRKTWFLPDWYFQDYLSSPCKYPQLKMDVSGTLNFSTKFALRGPDHVLFKVTKDLMRRLSRELRCDGPPMDLSGDGEGWIEIQNGEPTGCATTGTYSGERWLMGAWVRPEYRRTGVMSRIWSSIKNKHGVMKVDRPSKAMREWMKASQDWK